MRKLLFFIIAFLAQTNSTIANPQEYLGLAKNEEGTILTLRLGDSSKARFVNNSIGCHITAYVPPSVSLTLVRDKESRSYTFYFRSYRESFLSTLFSFPIYDIDGLVVIYPGPSVLLSSQLIAEKVYNGLSRRLPFAPKTFKIDLKTLKTMEGKVFNSSEKFLSKFSNLLIFDEA